MKQLIYSVLILSCILSLTFLGCHKDEIEPVQKNDSIQVETRSSSVDIVFYKGSLTTDNYLIANNNTVFRSYKIFNAAKISSVEMIASGLPDINSGGVLLKHYKIRVKFNDNTQYYFSAHSKSVGGQFIFTPTNINQLRDLHSAKYLDITISNRNTLPPLYNLWRDQTFIQYEWEIKKDGSIFIAKSILYPLDKNSNIFRPQMLD